MRFNAAALVVDISFTVRSTVAGVAAHVVIGDAVHAADTGTVILNMGNSCLNSNGSGQMSAPIYIIDESRVTGIQ